MLDLADMVYSSTACSLPGCLIKYDTFIPAMWEAVSLGYVSFENANYVAEGLRWGFNPGVRLSDMQSRGHRWFANYPTALAHKDAVTSAIHSRVVDHKTLVLGPWSANMAAGLKEVFRASTIFPMGAVEKSSQPGVFRPTDDHTRTGLNHLSDAMSYSLNAVNEIAEFLKWNHYMRVSDVADAFPLIPLSPDVWPYMLFRWYLQGGVTRVHLHLHIHGDFGTAGMPGVFKVFFSDVVVGMARAHNVLTLPMCIYVDDCALIGAEQVMVDSEMEQFHEWAGRICGVFFKWIKDRLASRVQLVLGLWWDSTTLTRTLEEKKLIAYMEMIAAFATRPTLRLKEMQQVAGRLQRCLLTFPPGAACLIGSLFALMVGLKLPWHLRRTSKRMRTDFAFIHRLLKLNLGRGYYSYEGFKQAPPILSDASKSQRFAGGGYVSQCGRHRWWSYGASARRKPIDWLEGDTVVVAAEDMSEQWRGCKVPFGVDNMSFEKSAAKGRSKAERLNVLIRELFALMLKFHFIIEFYWLSSEANFLADHLSRDRLAEFLNDVYSSGFWTISTPCLPHSQSGTVRTLPTDRGKVDIPTGISKARAEAADSGVTNHRSTHKSATPCDAHSEGPPKAHVPKRAQSAPRARGVSAKLLSLVCFFGFLAQGSTMPTTALTNSISYARVSMFAGLPSAFHEVVETIMDNRLSSSSWRTVQGGLNKWKFVAERQGWPVMIHTDDPHRGAKLVVFLIHLTTDTNLVWGSVEGYLWGVRTWMELQHQADPLMGVMGIEKFLKAIRTLTWVTREPRRRCSVETVKDIIAYVSTTDFFDTQMVFLILILLFTFSRSECPCPKAKSGRNSYNKEAHWRVEDFDPGTADDKAGIWVRFRVIKQDPRIERPEAQGDGDWSFVADAPGEPYSILHWYRSLMRLMGKRHDREGPMFIESQGSEQALTYPMALEAFKRLQRDVGVLEEDLAGLHGLRVEGYNGTEAAFGEDIAEAHGLWKSRTHKRYKRWMLATIARIPRAIMGQDDGDTERNTRPRGPPASRISRHNLSDAQEESDGDESEGDDSNAQAPPAPASTSNVLLPTGWREEIRTPASGICYKVYVGPNGERAKSRVQAWHVAEQSRVELLTHDDVVGSGSDSPASSGRRGAGRLDSGRLGSESGRLGLEHTRFGVASPVPSPSSLHALAPSTPQPLAITYEEGGRPARIHRAPNNFVPNINAQPTARVPHPHARARSISNFMNEQLRRMASPAGSSDS